MIYLLIATNVASLGLLALAIFAREADRAHYEQREQGLLNRIQAPQMAVAQSLPEQDKPGHISSFDDEALALFEDERARGRDE